MDQKEALSKKIRLTIILILFIFAYCVGYYKGNTRFSYKNMEEELKATEAMFKAQGDSPESIEKSLALIRITRLKEIGGAKREWFSIWIPSILIIVNIIATVYLSRKKK